MKLILEGTHSKRINMARGLLSAQMIRTTQSYLSIPKWTENNWSEKTHCYMSWSLISCYYSRICPKPFHYLTGRLCHEADREGTIVAPYLT